MNCSDCYLSGDTTPAIAVCHNCGAGICPDYAVSGRHALIAVRATHWQPTVDPPQGRLGCQAFADAIDAASELSAARRADRTVSASTGPRQ